MIARLIAVAILGYLLGSIPFGLIVGRLTKGVDVREYGSGRTGVANALRTMGVASAALVTLGDLAKGAGAVLLSGVILDSPWAQVLAALMAMVGHNWSVYIKFHGGRGVTTFFGGLLVVCWPVALICGGGVLLGVTAITRYFSLGSILGTIATVILMLPAVILWHQPVEYLVYTIIAASLIVFQHRGNIKRLSLGMERRVGEEAKPKRPSPGE